MSKSRTLTSFADLAAELSGEVLDATQLRQASSPAPARRRRRRRQARTYWLTPRVWNKACSHCGATSSIAYRHRGHKRACAACVERLGLKVRESRAWRDGGASTDPTVRRYTLEPVEAELDAELDQTLERAA